MEKIIYRYLCELFQEENVLAQYLYNPAVFDTKAPDDMDEGWTDEGAQYPRCIFQLDMQANPERKISGQLFVDVMVENEIASVQPEELEKLVHAAVDGCFFSNEELTISAQWRSSNDFDEKDNKLSGITLVFDIMAYPKQHTESPDPVLATNLWLKAIFPDSYVIGLDILPETWKPTDATPALYCRLSNLTESKRMKSTAAVTWIGADMRVYVMAPSEDIRSRINKSIVQLLINADKLILDDGSPMLIDSVNSDVAADPLREGQIQIKATYGVLNVFTGTPINSIIASGMNVEREVT